MRRLGVAAAALLLLVSALAGFLAAADLGGAGGGWSQMARSDIPPTIRHLYEQATDQCPRLSPVVLAGIGKVESDHGRSTAPGVRAGLNQAGCCAGPMQFNLTDGPPSTWQRYAQPGDDVYDPADAIPAAARKLCADGLGDPSGTDSDPCPNVPGPASLHRALLAYNAACVYVATVAGWAARYTTIDLGLTGADAQALLANARVELSAAARQDLAAGIIDPRLVTVLAALADRYPIRVSVLKTGHSVHVAGTQVVSNHFYGRAADVDVLDGAPVSRANAAAHDAVVWLTSIHGPLRPAEVGSPFPEFDPIHGWFSDTAHLDHLHLAYGLESRIFQQTKDSGL